MWMVMNNYFYLTGLIKHAFFPSLKFWGLLLNVWQKHGPYFPGASQFWKIESFCQIGHLKCIKYCIQIFVLKYVIVISKNDFWKEIMLRIKIDHHSTTTDSCSSETYLINFCDNNATAHFSPKENVVFLTVTLKFLDT